MIIASLVAGPLLLLVKIVPSVGFFIIVLLLIGGMNMTRMPTSESFLVSNVPASRRSTMLGVYFFAGAEMSGVLTPFVGRLIDTRGFETVFNIASVLLFAVAAICSILLLRARRSIRQAV